MKLKDKIALITGGSKGIGKSIAIAFAEEGADVILAARSQDLLEEVAQEVRQKGQQALPVVCDVSSSQAVHHLVDEVRKSYDRINILVNNAGVSKRSKFLEYDDETWSEVIRINLFSVYLCTRAFLPMMQKEDTGRIINIASAAGKTGVPFNSAYSASKHGVLGLTKSLASELAMTGFRQITVNAICPYFVDTNMFRGRQGYLAQMTKMTGVSEDELIEKIRASNLQHRILDSDEVASMAPYLASDDARGITGQSFNICGGFVFH